MLVGTAQSSLVGFPPNLQEEVLHDVVVVGTAAVGEKASRKDNDGVEAFAVVPWGRETAVLTVPGLRTRQDLGSGRRCPGRGLTSVGDHLHVRPDHMQVDAVLLFPDDDRAPQAPVGGAAVLGRSVPKQICAVSRHVLGGGHWGVIWKQDTRGPTSQPTSHLGLPSPLLSLAATFNSLSQVPSSSRKPSRIASFPSVCLYLLMDGEGGDIEGTQSCPPVGPLPISILDLRSHFADWQDKIRVAGIGAVAQLVNPPPPSTGVPSGHRLMS